MDNEFEQGLDKEQYTYSNKQEYIGQLYHGVAKKAWKLLPHFYIYENSTIKGMNYYDDSNNPEIFYETCIDILDQYYLTGDESGIKKLDRMLVITERWPELREFKPTSLSSVRDVKWIVPGILLDRGITAVVGLSEAGKTTFCLDLSKALLKEKKFLNSAIPINKKINQILWIEIDQPESMLKDEANKIDQELASSLDVYTNIHWNNEESIVENLDKVLHWFPYELVIIDSLGSIGLKNENDNSEVSALYKHLRELCNRYGISIILIHHLGKQSETHTGNRIDMKQRVRGAGDIVNKADCVLGLERVGNENIVHISTIKLRDKNRIDLDLIQDRDRLVFTEIMKKSDRIEELLLTGKSRAEIINIIHGIDGGRKDSIGKAVDRKRKELEGTGKIKPDILRNFK